MYRLKFIQSTLEMRRNNMKNPTRKINVFEAPVRDVKLVGMRK
jgi:hypothetical protein